MDKPDYAPYLHMRISPEHWKKLDELRRAEPDVPTRSDMIRRLIDRAAIGSHEKPRHMTQKEKQATQRALRRSVDVVKQEAAERRRERKGKK